ncbi:MULTISPECIES: very short patch repair endonuclease [unclassified Pseudomonas]|uniref:very short patch repair endonuclease n=1 Tax=unclassified Pseudomonas TaxID=196821 RepID=UPI000C8840CE|nr:MULTISPECIES: very short patch repair endonuclease [unclassified Pseudomonas]PMZ72465.1 very short patch repair endonuclease [Pseudomonas sp. GW247-3R2A]PMY73093.1 very short patch repair endonuclease [Pseudomonas sp. MPR-R3A]PMY97950.1 very short patch repair endonuclease [Pseudomonas sp. FW305-124]PNA91775.1 very short patch repair endonuclease [Pseudomonas sp. FW300-E2]PNB02866.1 very short patch repair endonuclease [Pseudomonas sp. MPR-AND1B]
MSRSDIMRAVKRAHTAPEMIVRQELHALGLRFRLHRRDLPGSPDIVLPRLRTVIFVHGCFWHRHSDCRYATTPKTRQEYWLPKFAANIERDARKEAQLQALGWRVLLVWECETKRREELTLRLRREFGLSEAAQDGALN